MNFIQVDIEELLINSFLPPQGEGQNGGGVDQTLNSDVCVQKPIPTPVAPLYALRVLKGRVIDRRP